MTVRMVQVIHGRSVNPREAPSKRAGGDEHWRVSQHQLWTSETPASRRREYHHRNSPSPGSMNDRPADSRRHPRRPRRPPQKTQIDASPPPREATAFPRGEISLTWRNQSDVAAPIPPESRSCRPRLRTTAPGKSSHRYRNAALHR